MNEVMTVQDVASRTGFCKAKVRSLIHSGKLHATNTSTGSRPTFHITEESLKAFLSPTEVMKNEPQPEKPRVVMPDKSIFDRIERELKKR